MAGRGERERKKNICFSLVALRFHKFTRFKLGEGSFAFCFFVFGLGGPGGGVGAPRVVFCLRSNRGLPPCLLPLKPSPRALEPPSPVTLKPRRPKQKKQSLGRAQIFG